MKISVCMATYNGAKYLKKQVDSILGQEFKENPNTEMELIVSDDGSTDATLNILREYNDSRIKIFNHTQNTLKHRYFNIFFYVQKILKMQFKKQPEIIYF